MSGMKILQLKDNCTGCAACMNKCPMDAISIKIDVDGFYRPRVDLEKCISCGACDKVCPGLNNFENDNDVNPSCYALWASDDVRKKSASGGAFTLLANWAFENNAKVYGCVYDENTRAIHIGINEEKDLDKLRKSKYVESYIGYCYRDILNELKRGRKVLFSGTPCQIAGLKSFLNKEYSDLYLVELVCNSKCPSGVFAETVRELEDKYRTKIINVDFRSKDYGWSGGKVKVFLQDGRVYEETFPYMQGFQAGLFKVDACYDCKYCGFPRQGDVTIGDFWGIADYNASFDDNKGTSLIFANSEKGKKLVSNISDKVKLFEAVDYKIAVRNNRFFNTPKDAETEKMREHFYRLRDKCSISEAISKALEKRYDIGLVGCYAAPNYGAQLTYYALYNVLSDMGQDVVLIDDFKQKNKWDETCLFKYEPYPKCAFAPEFKNLIDMKELNDMCEIFMTGSDQLWNYRIFGLSETYTLAFANADKKKLAYATSFGKNNLKVPAEAKAKMEYLINSFDKVSVRECDGVDRCEKIGVSATNVLDPVFLCDIKHYEKLMTMSGNKMDSPYVFCYITNQTEEKRQAIELLAKKIGKKLVLVNMYYTKLQNWEFDEVDVEYLDAQSCKIEDWLWHIYNCDMVITDSYHGYCFSLIFNKQVVTLFANSNVAMRGWELADMLKISRPTIANEFEITKYPKGYQLDYDVVNKNLELEIARCREWLIDAIFSKKDKVRYEDLLWQAMGLELMHLRDENEVQRRKINQLNANGKEVVLFGAGRYLEMYYAQIAEITPVKYVADNNSLKWGSIMFENIQCISPAEIAALKSPYVIIVIKNDEIVKNVKRQLEKLDVVNVVHISDFLEV